MIVPKLFSVPAVMQAHYCEKLQISVQRYVAAIARPSRAVLRGGLVEDKTPAPEAR